MMKLLQKEWFKVCIIRWIMAIPYISGIFDNDPILLFA